MGQISFEVPGPGTYSITADPTLAPLDSPGAAADVLTGKQFYKSDNTPVTGTMPNNPPEAVTIEAGGSYTIPQGYHSGTGTVSSEGTALPMLDNPGTAADLLAGKELIDGEGEKVTGSMANNGAVNETLNAGDSYTIPAGYHNGSGSVAAASLSSQTPGTADSGDIVSGQTAWVNGEQITGTLEPGYQTGDATATVGDILDGETAYVATGKVTATMPNNNAVTETLDAGAAYTIPAGYHNGQGTVTANSLANQTTGTATAEAIMQGETAWVNGQQITGTATPGTDTSDATATADQILSPYTAYVASGKVTGTIPTNTDDAVTINGEQVSVGAGYYANAVSKAIPTVAQAVPSITVSKTGLITATAAQDAGYVAQGTESATQQLPTQGAQTITPTTTAQTIEANVYLTGAQTIQGDANLVSANIKDGVSIFGVSGAYSGEPGSFSVPLIVTVASGATVTAQNESLELSAVSDGTATLMLTQSGDWTVSAILPDGQNTETELVHIPPSYNVTLVPEHDFAADSWSEIAEIAASGYASTYYALYDTKTVELSGIGTITLQIADFNHDFLSASTSATKAPITLIMKGYTPDSYQYNTTNTTIGGFPESFLYNNVLSTTIWDALPSDLRAVVKPIYKWYCTNGETGEGKWFQSSIWIPLGFELVGENDFIPPSEHTEGGARQYPIGEPKNTDCWVASPRNRNTTRNCYYSSVIENKIGAEGAAMKNPVCFGLCI